jgi:hypothetical protein
MIMMLRRHHLVAGSPIREFISLYRSDALQLLQISVNRRERHTGVCRSRTPIELRNIGMISRLDHQPNDKAPLLRHAKMLVRAAPFDLS